MLFYILLFQRACSCQGCTSERSCVPCLTWKCPRSTSLSPI